MIIRPPKGREIIHLWIAIGIALLVSLYTLTVQLMEPLQNFFLPYTSVPVVKWGTFILYFWILFLLWIAYRRWQQAIDRGRELERVIASISPDALMVVSPDRQVRMCNTAVKKVFGYEPEEVVGNTTDLLYYDRRVNREKGEIASCLRKFGFHVGYATGRRKNGETVPLEIITGDLNGQPGAVILIRDITERKQAEEALRISYEKQQNALRQLRQTQQQIVQHERLRILGKMASYIAHEFNNALTPIMGFSEMLLGDFERYKGSDELHSYIQDINTAANDASAVVKRLREFYKVRDENEAGHVLDINETVRDTISMTRPKWKDEAQSQGRDIAFETDLQDIPQIPGNADEIREVLTNLIFNAVDAMPDGGTISISTGCEDGSVLLRVSDSGVGMDDELRERCFEPFYSSSGGSGSGLGLVVVSSIVGRHNGTIDLESRAEHGTTFNIRLPISPVEHAATADPVHPSVGRQLRVLVADDELLIRKLLVQFLEHDGHTVSTASHGRAALDMFKTGGYDLVITDWAMPEMNGADLSEAIKQVAPSTPVVMMTGFDSGHPGNERPDTAADFKLSKPITRDSLQQMIDKALSMIEEKRDAEKAPAG